MPNATEILPDTQATATAVPKALLTRSGQRLLLEELDHLRRQLDAEFVERLREARDFGESGSNDDYLQIKEEEAVLRSRIGRLESLLDTAIVVETEGSEDGVIAIGAVVDVKDVRSGRLSTHRVLGSFALQGTGDVSATSPIGQALLGRSVGDSVDVELPNGKTKRLKIVSVSAGDGDAGAPR
jgi:transcription elongation factor GreA